MFYFISLYITNPSKFFNNHPNRAKLLIDMFNQCLDNELGFNSKMVITGDISQIDLPKGIKSGLVVACKILKGIDKIEIVEFEKYDVVRHPLVAKIIERYEEYEGV